MSINKAKLYIGYYSSYTLLPVYFTLCFIKGVFDSFFKALKETVEVNRTSSAEFERRKSFTDNQ